ncbi:MAG: thiamine permease [Alphaproteobacteria bacterium]|nr:ECF transporter S component [Alphaproteobacteria bacterium]TAD87492.1 MAG: thiamine permease [Alphaproteobacteria bacterium]
MSTGVSDRADPLWTLRETMIVAALGAAFAVICVGWLQLYLLALPLAGNVVTNLMFGVWFLPALLAAYAIRKPGVALVTEVLAAVLQLFLGNPSGLILFLTGLVQGAGVEVVLAATRYRRWGIGVLLAAGAGAAVFSFLYNWVRFSWGATLSMETLSAIFVLRVISGMVLCGLGAKLLGDALWRTGVFAGLALDHAKRTGH